MNKYLKDIFIHLDGIAMCSIYELINSNKANIINSKNTSKAYKNILDAILEAQKINYSEINKLPYNFSGIKNYYKSAVDLIQINNLNKGLHGQIIQSFNEQFNKLYLNYLDAAEIKKSMTEKREIAFKHMEGALIAPLIIYLSYLFF